MSTLPSKMREIHILYLATSPELEGVTGKCFVQKEEAQSSLESYNRAIAERLWEVSEQLVGQRFNWGHKGP